MPIFPPNPAAPIRDHGFVEGDTPDRCYYLLPRDHPEFLPGAERTWCNQRMLDHARRDGGSVFALRVRLLDSLGNIVRDTTIHPRDPIPHDRTWVPKMILLDGPRVFLVHTLLPDLDHDGDPLAIYRESTNDYDWLVLP